MTRPWTLAPLQCCDLYQLHWPGFFADSGFWDGLADCADKGLVKAVGVSNYSEKRLRNAHKALAERGVPLVSNQVFSSRHWHLHNKKA